MSYLELSSISFDSIRKIKLKKIVKQLQKKKRLLQLHFLLSIDLFFISVQNSLRIHVISDSNRPEKPERKTLGLRRPQKGTHVLRNVRAATRA